MTGMADQPGTPPYKVVEISNVHDQEIEAGLDRLAAEGYRVESDPSLDPARPGACPPLFVLLMCDGSPGGRSAGKWLTGLKVVRVDREPMDFQSSLLRNLTVTSPFLLYLVPAVRPFLASTLRLAGLLIDTYLGFYDSDGQRAGGTFAETEIGRATV